MDSGDSKSRVAFLDGMLSPLTVTCDHDREWTSDIPLICCSAPRGYVRLPGFISGDPRRDRILSVADWMTGARGGAFVVVFPRTGEFEGLALIQSDHDGQGNEGFYQRHHEDSHGVWRDFYFQTVHTALQQGDALWASDEIQIAHPINGGWDLELLTVVLEAIGHLSDQQVLNAKTIHLDCLHGDHTADFKKALETLNREQTDGDGSAYRDFKARRETDHFEAQHPGSDGALYWIQIGGQEKDAKNREGRPA